MKRLTAISFCIDVDRSPPPPIPRPELVPILKTS
jgi:hypothetical protein